MAAPIAIHLEFGGLLLTTAQRAAACPSEPCNTPPASACRGGAELLFKGVKEHHVTLPSQSEPWDMKQLLVWIQRNLLKERPELFVQRDSVRPGILVLINDADWELMGQLDYQLQDQDNVVFISTLHGG